jgi:hypothetical protein
VFARRLPRPSGTSVFGRRSSDGWFYSGQPGCDPVDLFCYVPRAWTALLLSARIDAWDTRLAASRARRGFSAAVATGVAADFSRAARVARLGRPANGGATRAESDRRVVDVSIRDRLRGRVVLVRMRAVSSEEIRTRRDRTVGGAALVAKVVGSSAGKRRRQRSGRYWRVVRIRVDVGCRWGRACHARGYRTRASRRRWRSRRDDREVIQQGEEVARSTIVRRRSRKRQTTRRERWFGTQWRRGVFGGSRRGRARHIGEDELASAAVLLDEQVPQSRRQLSVRHGEGGVESGRAWKLGADDEWEEERERRWSCVQL